MFLSFIDAGCVLVEILKRIPKRHQDLALWDVTSNLFSPYSYQF